MNILYINPGFIDASASSYESVKVVDDLDFPVGKAIETKGYSDKYIKYTVANIPRLSIAALFKRTSSRKYTFLSIQTNKDTIYLQASDSGGIGIYNGSGLTPIDKPAFNDGDLKQIEVFLDATAHILEFYIDNARVITVALPEGITQFTAIIFGDNDFTSVSQRFGNIVIAEGGPIGPYQIIKYGTLPSEEQELPSVYKIEADLPAGYEPQKASMLGITAGAAALVDISINDAKVIEKLSTVADSGVYKSIPIQVEDGAKITISESI